MWYPIETAPKNTTTMYVVKGFDVLLESGRKYTTDPYCVWEQNGKYVRWPHEFRPTHWMPLPEAP